MNGTSLTTIAVLAVLGGAIFAQERSNPPGMPTQARVWIENRGAAQAIPVTAAETVGVRVLAPVSLEPATVVNTHVARQQWEYRTVAIPPGDDAAVALKSAGAEGWEAVGVLSGSRDAGVLMKRPR